jgi:hypothetical protein
MLNYYQVFSLNFKGASENILREARSLVLQCEILKNFYLSWFGIFSWQYILLQLGISMIYREHKLFGTCIS